MVNRPQVGVSAIAFHESIFPLHDHAQMLIVQQQDLHRQFFAIARRQLLDIHLEAAVAVDIDHQRTGMGGLHAHRGGQPETHGAQPGAGEPMSRLIEFVELSGPHLMLADAHRHVGVAVARQLGQLVDRVLLQDPVVTLRRTSADRIFSTRRTA